MVECPLCRHNVQLEFSYLLVHAICLLFKLKWCFKIILKTERRVIDYLCWFLDITGLVVVVSLYFTLHLYFGNIVHVNFSKQLTRCSRNFDWSHTIFFGLFPQRMSSEYAVEKASQSVPTCL